MAKKYTNLLGIAVTERSVRVVECRGSGTSAKVGKSSSFDCDGSALFDSPERFGARLAEHLSEHGYKTKHAAVGLSPRWVLAKPAAVPPVEGEALAGMVRLKVERAFAGGQGELCFDFQDAPLPADAGEGLRGLLLVGLPRRRLDKVETAIAAAGLGLVRVGAMPLDLCWHSNGDGIRLQVDTGGITLASVKSGQCAGFATAGVETGRLGTNPDAAQQIAAAATRLAMTGLPAALENSGTLCVTDVAGLDAAALPSLTDALTERFGRCEIQSADPALAAAATVGQRDTINLLDSKLAVKPARALPGYAKWLVRAAVLLLLIGGVVGYLWLDTTSELASLRDEYDAIHENADKLHTVRTDTRAAAGWFDDRPPVLDCLLELTQTFPKRDRIWVTSLAIQPDATGLVSCRAEDEETMWLYVNAMNSSPNLASVALRRQNDGGREDAEIVFDVSFRYAPTAAEGEAN